jgi:hypothetical protein
VIGWMWKKLPVAIILPEATGRRTCEQCLSGCAFG